MSMNVFLSMMTGGIFDGFLSNDKAPPSPESRNGPTPIAVDEEERGRKRSRDDCLSMAGSQTPTLTAPRHDRLDHAVSLPDERAPKRLRGELRAVPVPMPDISNRPNTQLGSDLLSMVPEEVVGYALSFLGSTADRFSLQTTCTQFKRISNTDSVLVNVKLGGDLETGKNGIIQEEDTAATAAVALTPFARAGNVEAIYM
jgi:hypothetical protein